MESEKQYVLFHLAATTYALDIAGVQEIIPMPALTHVPLSVQFIVGITNLRGAVVPVLDLRQRCGLPAAEATPATRVMVVQYGDRNLGLIVDGVEEVITLPASAMEPVASMVQDSRGEQLVAGVARLDQRLLLLLDLARVIPSGVEGAFPALTPA